MELHHLHVAQREPRAQRHRHAVAALVARGRVEAIHRGAAAGGEQHALRLHEDEAALANVDHHHTGERAIGGQHELERAVLLQALHARHPHLLGQAVDDLDAGEIPLVDGAVEGLARERLLVDRAVGVAIEEAAELVLELAHALDRFGHERPREVLVRQPLAALDRVHEVALDRVSGRQRHVVSALDHARAAALAEQALHRDGDAEVRGGALGVQRGEESGATRAENEDVGPEPSHFPIMRERPPFAARAATTAHRCTSRARRNRTSPTARSRAIRRR